MNPNIKLNHEIFNLHKAIQDAKNSYEFYSDQDDFEMMGDALYEQDLLQTELEYSYDELLNSPEGDA